MENKINFGIDLGTTNSVICKFVKGNVEVFRNPNGFKETLPSIVGFRKERILIGDAARTYAERDSKSVIHSFKRKMGTSETFSIKSLSQIKTPVELSAYVLKELKTFVHSGEPVAEVVITIPASFDIVQSNATKEAGLQAGFNHVELLQEPIAASLAYANKQKTTELKDGQWLVYDLGGGTFDVALVKIKNGELKVVDHEGNNYLGGTDFDDLIVEKIIVPHLQDEIDEEIDFNRDLRSASGRLNQLYLTLLHRAEEAKVTLSSKTSAEIEFNFKYEDFDEDVIIDITRSEFESLIKEKIDETAQMIKSILTRNSLTAGDVQFVLMVGGSTYIPYVRKRIEELLQIPLNLDIDPTTAVAIGAAYYAGTKDKSSEKTEQVKQTQLSVKMSYIQNTREEEELFAAKVTGDVENLFYRITRDDGGFDTGLKQLSGRISEDLPLVKDHYNYFKFLVFDGFNNPVETNASPIGIAQGRYGIAGQPLSQDICLEIDDFDRGMTGLELIFSKNSTLPLKKQLSKTISKNITYETGDYLVINVLEGPSYAFPAANKPVGQLIITREQLERDVVKGADIDLTINFSESRELTVSAYVPMTDQTFTQIFKEKEREVIVKQLATEVANLSFQIKEEIKAAEEHDDWETQRELMALEKEAEDLFDASSALAHDDGSDARYQIEDKKRKIAQAVDGATKDKRLAKAKAEYFAEKEACQRIVQAEGTDEEKQALDEAITQEPVFLNSTNSIKIEERAALLRRIRFRVLWRNPDFLLDNFAWLEEISHTLKNPERAAGLIFTGKQARENKNWEKLSEVISDLLDLVPEAEQEKHTGIVGIF